MGAAGRTGVTWPSRTRQAGPTVLAHGHEYEHEQYFGKIVTEAANMSMLAAALPWASDHNQFQRHSHKTQDTDRKAYSRVCLHGGPERLQIKVGRRSMRMSQSRAWDMTGTSKEPTNPGSLDQLKEPEWPDSA